MQRPLVWLRSIVLQVAWTAAVAAPLGLPPVPVPADIPQTAARVKPGDKRYHDTQPGAAGKVSCATCHDAARVSRQSAGQILIAPPVTPAGTQ